MKIVLVTQRLYLREFFDSDIKYLYKMMSDKKVMKFYPKTLSEEECMVWLKSAKEEYRNKGTSWYAMCLKDGTFIGQAGIVVRMINSKEEYMLAYMIDAEYQNYGYATEAGKALVDFVKKEKAASRVICLIQPQNLKSIAVAKKIGFVSRGEMLYKGYKHILFDY